MNVTWRRGLDTLWRLALSAALVAWVYWTVTTGPARTGPLLANTAKLLLGVLVGTIPLGTLLAALLFRTDLPARNLWRVLLIVPLFIPLAVYAGAWQAVFGTQGLLASLTGLSLTRGFLPAVIVHSAAALPWVILIVGLGLRSVEPELEEDAMLSADSFRVLWYVSLRRASGGLLTAGLLVTAITFGEMTVTDLFQVRTYAEEVYVHFTLHRAVSPLVLAGVPGMVLVALFMGLAAANILQWAPRRWEILWSARRSFSLGQWKIPAVGLVGLLALTIVGVVVGSLVWKAGLTSRATTPTSSESPMWSEPVFEQAWSLLSACETLLTGFSQTAQELRSSLQVGLLASAIAVAIGLMVAWRVLRDPEAVRPVGFVMGLLLAVPGPLVGLGLIMTFNRPGPLGWIYDSPMILVLGQALRVWPFVFLAIWAPLRMIPREVLDLLRLDGAGLWQGVRDVQLPLSVPAAALGLLTGLALCLGELAVSVLVEPPGTTTLSVRIFQFLHYGLESHLAGITLVLVLLVLITSGLLASLSALISRSQRSGVVSVGRQW